MAQWLREDTATVINFGPFVDKTDGVAYEIGLVSALDHVSTGIMLSKNGGALTIRHATVTASTYDARGHYLVTLDTTDTNTPGRLRVEFSEPATCLPVWQDFLVVPQPIFDSYCSATAGAIPNVVAGAAGGLFIAGTNAATSVTTALTANLTGNITGNVTGTISDSAGVTEILTRVPDATPGANGGLPTVNASNQVAGVAAGVTLADDAITASKFDESTAFPLKSADTGSSAVARTGADSDTLETISDQIDAAASANDVADAMLARDIGSGTGAGTLNERTVRSALRLLRNKRSVAAGVLTVKKENDTDDAWTAAVTGTSGADPITAIDPT